MTTALLRGLDRFLSLFVTAPSGLRLFRIDSRVLRSPVLAALVAGLPMAVPVAAQSPVLVEFYTSQGCSACPPADALLADLAPRDDVIALALHVDYWDYLGWADPFAHRRFTERQKSYARAAGARMIYTPQAIVAGADRIEGFRRDAIGDLIHAHGANQTPVRLELERIGERVRISATAERPLSNGVVVHFVRYRPSQTVTIERGENAGRTGTYHNIVTLWEQIADWRGDAPLALETDALGSDAVVVILQEPGPGAVIAAARLR